MSQSAKKPGGGRPKRHLADGLIAALLTSPDIGSAAKAAGVSRTTATRWLGEPWFAKRYRQARAAVLGSVVGQLTASLSEAVTALRVNLTDPDPRVRTSSANALLTHGGRMAEILDIDSRLSALEAKADPPGP